MSYIAIIKKRNILFRFIWAAGLSTIVISAITIAFSFSIRFAFSQQTLAIAATINDDMVSVLDLKRRLALSIRLSGLSNTLENRKRLGRQTLRSLIDEKLKLQEAKKYKINTSRAEISKAEQRFERRAGLAKGELRNLLKDIGIDPSILRERLESNVAWSKLIFRRYSPTISISEKEIDDFIDTLKKNKGKPEYLISEIYLPLVDEQQSLQVRELASRLIQKIQDGSSFAAIARNFSQSPTAAVGGSLGWNNTEQLKPDIKTAVKNLSPGQTVGPIETIDGVYIVRLDDKRTSDPFRGPDPQPATVTLSQVHYPLPLGASKKFISESFEKARQIAAKVKDCAEIDKLAMQGEPSLSGRLGTFKVNQLSKKLKNISMTLPINQASEPIINDSSITIIMVCDRTIPVVDKPTPTYWRKKIKARLINKRLDLVSEQYIRNIRRTAIVDIRL